MDPAAQATAPDIVPLGDSAALILLADVMGEPAARRVRAALAALEAAPLHAVTDIVSAYTTLAVFYDPTALPAATPPFDQIRAALQERLSMPFAATTAAEPRVIEIPVRYGGADGPDLESVAQHTGLSAAQVIDLHSAAAYSVAMIGFAPGFPYLLGLPPRLATPRRSTPRTAVPAGSVGIAGAQTGIYPLETPGGWQIVGRTDTRLFDPLADPPTLLRIGDVVRFRSVT